MERIMTGTLVLFFVVHYGILPIPSRTTALFLFTLSTISLAIVRFKYMFQQSQKNTDTTLRYSQNLALADALVVSTGGIGFSLFASYAVVQSEIVHMISLALLLVTLLFFGIKRTYLIKIYGKHSQAV